MSADSLIKELNDFSKYSLAKGDYEKTLQKLEQSLAIASSADAFYYKGLAAYGKGDFAGAIDSWMKTLNFNVSDNARKDINLYIGLAYYQEKPDKAREYFLKYSPPTQSEQLTERRKLGVEFEKLNAEFECVFR